MEGKLNDEIREILRRTESGHPLEEETPELSHELQTLRQNIDIQELPFQVRLALALEIGKVIKPPPQEHKQAIYSIFHHCQRQEEEIADWIARAFDLGRAYECSMNKD